MDAGTATATRQRPPRTAHDGVHEEAGARRVGSTEQSRVEDYREAAEAAAPQLRRAAERHGATEADIANLGLPKEAGTPPDRPIDKKGAQPPGPTKTPAGYTTDGLYRTQEEITAAQRAGAAAMRETVAAAGPELRRSAEHHAALEAGGAKAGPPNEGVSEPDARTIPKDPPGTSEAERFERARLADLAASGTPTRANAAQAAAPAGAARPSSAPAARESDPRTMPKGTRESPYAASVREFAKGAGPAQARASRTPLPVRGAGRPVGGGMPQGRAAAPAQTR